MKGLRKREGEKPDLLSQWKRAVESLSLIQVEGWSASTRINSPVTSQAKITETAWWGQEHVPNRGHPTGYLGEICSLPNNTQLLSHLSHRRTYMGHSANPCHHNHTEQHHEIQRFHMFSAQRLSSDFPSLFEASFPLLPLLTLRSIQHRNDNKGVIVKAR